VRAACLVACDVAVASDLTAGRLWGLKLPAPEVIEVTTHRGRQMRLAGVRHHRRSALREVIAKRGPGYDPGGSDREYG
jgi:hypothetical protein